MNDGNYDVPAETVAWLDTLRHAGFDFAIDASSGGLLVLPAEGVPITDDIWALLAPFDEALRRKFVEARDCAGPLRH